MRGWGEGETGGGGDWEKRRWGKEGEYRMSKEEKSKRIRGDRKTGRWGQIKYVKYFSKKNAINIKYQ